MSRLSFVLALAVFAGCVSVEEDARAAREAIRAGTPAAAVAWGEDLAINSTYSKNLGTVEAGRLALLAGDAGKAEQWFRAAIDSAVDRKENTPDIKLGDVGNALLAATVTDDRTRDYYLAPYEINLALGYGILAELMDGKREDALVDARLAVYIQDSLAKTYGEDLEKSSASSDAQATSAGAGICANESAALQEMMASTRNSWENPVLWWLTGALFESDGEMEMAAQSYRKAAACRPDNPVFVSATARADRGVRTPERGRAKLLVLYEEGLVPQRESLKIPVPIYTHVRGQDGVSAEPRGDLGADKPRRGDAGAGHPCACRARSKRTVAGHRHSQHHPRGGSGGRSDGCQRGGERICATCRLRGKCGRFGDSPRRYAQLGFASGWAAGLVGRRDGPRILSDWRYGERAHGHRADHPRRG